MAHIDSVSPQNGDWVVYNQKFYEDNNLESHFQKNKEGWNLVYQVDEEFNIAYYFRNQLYKFLLGRKFKRKPYFAGIYEVNSTED